MALLSYNGLARASIELVLKASSLLRSQVPVKYKLEYMYAWCTFYL